MMIGARVSTSGCRRAVRSAAGPTPVSFVGRLTFLSMVQHPTGAHLGSRSTRKGNNTLHAARLSRSVRRAIYGQRQQQAPTIPPPVADTAPDLQLYVRTGKKIKFFTYQMSLTLHVNSSDASNACLLLNSASGDKAKVVNDGHADAPVLVSAEGPITGTFAIAQALLHDNESLMGSNPAEKADVSQWFTFCNRFDIDKLNHSLLPLTYLVSHRLTAADLVCFAHAHPVVSRFSDYQKFYACAVTRWLVHVQRLPSVAGKVSALGLVHIKHTYVPEDYVKAQQAAKAEKEAAKAGKGKDADAKKPDGKKGGDDKKKGEEKKGDDKKGKEKKEKGGKGAAAAADDAHPASKLNIRVGQIKKVWKHPEADSLYCEEIDIGEEKPRSVCSGLVKFIPIEQMENRRVVVLCNLKPANMRGVRSEAMVLAASNADHTVVELVSPPEGAPIGARITFDGYPGEPESQLNPKKKIFEAVQPDLHTKADGVAYYKDAPFKTEAGNCTCSLKNGSIK